jgi:hypothetical protein
MQAGRFTGQLFPYKCPQGFQITVIRRVKKFLAIVRKWKFHHLIKKPCPTLNPLDFIYVLIHNV